MNDLSNSQMPVAPLNDVDLEQVSGGNLYVEGSSMYTLISTQLQGILAPFKDDISSWENSVRYKDVLETLHTYDTSSKSDAYLASFYANSWNTKHPNSKQQMNADLAHAILSIENKYDRAAIACLGTPTQMEKAIIALYNS